MKNIKNMKIKTKSAFKYQVFESIKPLMIYYTIIYAILIFMVITDRKVYSRGVTATIGGIEFSSIIFIFIAGLNSFKTTFHFFLANSVSRKTLFMTYVLSIVPIAGFMAFLDTANGYMASLFSRYNPAFYQFYGPRYGINNLFSFMEGGKAIYLLESFLWSLFVYSLMAMIGYFITVLYYRLSKLYRYIVSFGVPIFFIIIIPYLDYNIFNGKITQYTANFFAKAWGYSNGYNPYIAMLSCAIGFMGFAGLSFLLMRKAALKA